MVRPKTKNGKQIQLYLSAEVLDLIERYRGSLSASAFIEEAVLFVIKGREREIDILIRNEELKHSLKKIATEKELLEKENERLKKKIERLERENEILKARWRGQATLTKYEKRSKELNALVKKIQENIRERMTWREVMAVVGIIEPADQVDLLKRLWQKNGVDYEFKSDHFPGWVLRDAGGRGGYLDYVFMRRDKR